MAEIKVTPLDEKGGCNIPPAASFRPWLPAGCRRWNIWRENSGRQGYPAACSLLFNNLTKVISMEHLKMRIDGSKIVFREAATVAEYMTGNSRDVARKVVEILLGGGSG